MAQNRYFSDMQNISYIAGNIISIYDDWFLKFFPNNYFKTIRHSTETDFVRFKGFMKGITKHDKPIWVVNPDISVVEDSIFMNTYNNRFNPYDPGVIDNKLATSEELFMNGVKDAILLFRRNKYHFRFDNMIVVSSVLEQLQVYNNMLNDFRNKSLFSIDRTIQNVIPIKFINAIAEHHNMDYKSDAFLKFLNANSNYPIIRKKMMKGDYMFFFLEENMITVTIRDIPSKDSIDQNNMIVNSARITHIIEFDVTIPSEFIMLINETSHVANKKLAHLYSPEMLLFIPPFENCNVMAPDVFDNKRKVDQVDLIIENEEEYTIQITDLIDSSKNEKLLDMVNDFIRSGIDLSTFMNFKVWKDSKEFPLTYTTDKLGIALEPLPQSAFTITMYLDMEKYNSYQIQQFSDDKI